LGFSIEREEFDEREEFSARAMGTRNRNRGTVCDATGCRERERRRIGMIWGIRVYSGNEMK